MPAYAGLIKDSPLINFRKFCRPTLLLKVLPANLVYFSKYGLRRADPRPTVRPEFQTILLSPLLPPGRASPRAPKTGDLALLREVRAWSTDPETGRLNPLVLAWASCATSVSVLPHPPGPHVVILLIQ